MPATQQSGILESPFVPQTLTVKCSCGGRFEVALSDVAMEKHILSRCCNENAPLADLREAINHYIQYVDARATLIGKGWDVELPIEPGCRPVA